MHDEFGSTEPRQTNTLGLVGLILAFCLSPIGLLISLVALTKTPRGLAIGGVVVGAIGTVLWGLGAAGLVAGWGLAKQGMDVWDDYMNISMSLEQRLSEDGEYPEDLSGLMLSEDHLTDPWGNAYRYEKTGPQAYVLTASGRDATFGTDDDMRLTPGMSEDDFGEAFGDSFEASMTSGGATNAAPETDEAPVEVDETGSN